MTVLAAACLCAATFSRPLERVSSIDPVRGQSAYDAHAIGLVFEAPLSIDYEARPYRLAPGYCELPEIGENGLRYVFRVRSGKASGDGVERRAEDVVSSLERLRDPTSPNGWIVKDVESMSAVDSKTVEIRLRRRVRYFSWLMAMPSCAVVSSGGEGTGGFRLAKWRKNHEMSFVRRHPSPGGFDEIRYLVIDDVSTQWLMFLKGEVDLLANLSRDTLDAITGPDGRLVPELAKTGARLYSMPTLQVYYVGVNMRDPVLGPNRKLRQALNCAFDFPAWNEFYGYRIEKCNGPVPPGVEGRLETPFPYDFDLDKARRLVAEAGYPDGIDPKTGRRLVLTLSIGRPDQSSREAGELMAAFYEKIGIKMELAYMTWDAFMTAVNEGRVQLYRMAWVGDYPDAQNFLQLFYGPNRSPGSNHSNYENPEFDAAYESTDYLKCQEIVMEDCPWIFTNCGRAYTLVGPRVGNYVPSDFPYGNEQFYRAAR